MDITETYYPSSALMTVIDDAKAIKKKIEWKDLQPDQKHVILLKTNIDETMIDSSSGAVIKSYLPGTSQVTVMSITGSDPDPWQMIFVLDGVNVLSFASFVES